MRLSVEQVAVILDVVHGVAGAEARVSLYGSRLDESRRGGDVDLLVESSPPLGLLQRARIKVALERKLNLPVDVLAAPLAEAGVEDSAFVAMARGKARRLEPAALEG